MATIFTPTKVRDLKEGDLLDAYPERVYTAPEPSDALPGYLTFLIVDTDNLDAPMEGLAEPDDVIVVRTHVVDHIELKEEA